MTENISKHGSQRGFKRMGYKTDTLETLADVARKQGITSKDAKGELKKQLQKIEDRLTDGVSLKYLGHNVYLFGRGGVLVTCYPLSAKRRKQK